MKISVAATACLLVLSASPVWAAGPVPAGRSLDDVLKQETLDPQALQEAKDLLVRLDAATEAPAKDLLARQVAVLVRRNLALFTQAAQTDGPDRRLAIRALTLAVAPDTVELMVKLLDAPALDLRLDAVKALGELRDERSTAALVARLADAEPAMRRAAAQALGRLADRRSVDPMLARLDAESDAAVRLTLVESFRLMRALEAKVPLEKIAADQNTPKDLKDAAQSALAAINTPDPEFKIDPRSRENPLPSIAEQMDSVEGQLDYYWSGERTQAKQEQIVKALDDLIKMLEEQQQGQGQGEGQGQGQGQGQQSGSQPGSGQGGTSPNPNDSASDAGAGGDEEHARNRIFGIPWGKLPPAVRGEVEQALKENLPERYRRLLEGYTKALAEAEDRRR